MRRRRKARHVQFHDLLQVTAVAEYCRVTRATVYGWLKSGKLESLMIGDLVREALRPLRKPRQRRS